MKTEDSRLPSVWLVPNGRLTPAESSFFTFSGEPDVQDTKMVADNKKIKRKSCAERWQCAVSHGEICRELESMRVVVELQGALTMPLVVTSIEVWWSAVQRAAAEVRTESKVFCWKFGDESHCRLPHERNFSTKNVVWIQLTSKGKVHSYWSQQDNAQFVLTCRIQMADVPNVKDFFLLWRLQMLWLSLSWITWLTWERGVVLLECFLSSTH